MGFNKNTWNKDYSGSAGLKTLAKQDAKLKKRAKERSKEESKK